MSDTLTMLAIAMIRHLETKGWAVAMFSPCEVNHAAADRVTEAMIEAGWRAIDAAEAESDNARDDV